MGHNYARKISWRTERRRKKEARRIEKNKVSMQELFTDPVVGDEACFKPSSSSEPRKLQEPWKPIYDDFARSSLSNIKKRPYPGPDAPSERVAKGMKRYEAAYAKWERKMRERGFLPSVKVG